jgi:hypothetical protein
MRGSSGSGDLSGNPGQLIQIARRQSDGSSSASQL